MKKKNNKSIKKRSQNVPYERLLRIDSYIAEGKYPSAPKLSEKLEVSTPTIKRDISYMRYILNAPIEYDEHRKGYYYSHKTFRLPAIFRDESDVLAGSIAAKLLVQYKNTPIYERVINIFEHFNNVLSGDKKNDPNWFNRRILFLGESVPEIANDVWNTIIKAICNNFYIGFSYKAPSFKRERHGYYIAPYQLVCKAGIWYLAGYSKRKDVVALYALNRIFNISITREHFEVDKDYNYLDNSSNLIGVSSFDKKVKCRVQFFGNSANYVAERIWADEQTIEHFDDGSVIVTFYSGQLYEVLRWVFTQGSNAIPLEPKELVDLWKGDVISMYENIKSREVV